MKQLTAVVFGLALLTCTASRADHTDPSGSIGRLEYETQELVREVRYAPLSYNVKSAVYYFEDDVKRLDYCADSERKSTQRDHTTIGCPNHCLSYLYRAQNSFREVDRYLWDTHFDLPRVYYAYVDTKEALRSIQAGPGPGPSPTASYRCTATDTGWEEHPGGHVGYGRYVDEAQRNAYNQCYRYHGKCRMDRCIIVNK